MRVMIAAGGTGGHVYPALAVAEAMIKDRPDDKLFFVGAVGGFERPLIEAARLPFAAYDEVHAGPLHGVNPFRVAVSLAKLALGTARAWRLLRRHQPHVLLLTGGWVGAPVALAAWLRRVPMLLYLPDIEPGQTILMLRRIARCVAVTVEESVSYFRRGQAVVTGYPLRQALYEAARQGREKAIGHFGLDPNRKTLLVFGGSRGARSINIALLNILPDLLADGLQVIHVTGTLDWSRAEAQKSRERYRPFAYLHDDMGLALAAADLVVCRAGASVLGELPFFGVPSILVPYPHAWRYQKVNADYLAERGAAVRMNDETMVDDLLPTIRRLFTDPSRLADMRARASQLAQPDGARRVMEALIRLGEEGA